MKNVVYVESHTYVTSNSHSLVFRNVINKKERYIPLIDVEFIVFDHINCYFSTKLLIHCNEHQIGLLFCNEKHIPIATLYSEYNYHQKLRRLQSQMLLPKRVKSRLWQKMIKSKIYNQAICMEYIVQNKVNAKLLMEIMRSVESNDQTHREAYAARVYFSRLFDESFKRGRYKDSLNGSLNYTYAIIRALIRKELCAHGFEPSIGIHHQSTENPFNLSDDVIEVYRPFVDAYVYEQIYQKNISKLDKPVKQKLVQILFERCILDNRIYYLSDAIKLTISSLIICYEKQSVKYLKLPRFIEGGA